jgi:hypothetical protein
MSEVNSPRISDAEVQQLASGEDKFIDGTTPANAVYLTGNVGIGAQPDGTALLDIAGKFKIADGTEGANFRLACDANGLASWVEVHTGKFATLRNLDTIQELNSVPGVDVLWGTTSENTLTGLVTINAADDGFTVDASGAGVYMINANLHVTSSGVRSSIAAFFTINGVPQGRGATTYIRNNGGHSTDGVSMSSAVTLAAGDIVRTQAIRSSGSTVASPVNHFSSLATEASTLQLIRIN